MIQQDMIRESAVAVAREFHEPVFVFYDPAVDKWGWGFQPTPALGEILICEIRRFARL